MTTVLQNPTSDSYVVEASPAYNNGSSRYLTVTGPGSSTTRYAYVYFNRPFPLGVTVQSAILRLYQHSAATGGARVLSAKRVASSWKESKITWANKPSTGGSSSSSASQGNGGADGRVWEIDITTLLQEISDGAAWYGLRIASDNTTLLSLFSSEADDFQPQIEIEWSDAPEAPETLSPSNGRAVSIARPTLRFDFTDVSGDLTMQAYQVQINSSDSWSSPLIDTGTVASSLPEHTLTADTPASTLRYWRVRVQDGAGLWSDWSEAASFTRTAKPTVAINSPSGGTVTEGTPPVLWTVTGTQTAYQVFLTDPVDTSIVLWTSGKVTSADNSLTIPDRTPPLLTPGASYGLTLRIWDDVVRESTPGDPVYTDTSTTFTFNLSATVAAVTSLAVVVAKGSPNATLTWNSSTAPDSFTILLDGAAEAVNVNPADVFVSGTSYAYPLRAVKPRTAHVASVLRVVNGVTSASNPTVSVTTEPEGAWLSTVDGLHAIRIGGQDPVSFDASELSTIRKPLGATNPVIITQAVYGREGGVAGDLERVGSQTLADAVAEWEAITNRELYARGTPMILTAVDTAMRVFIYNPVRSHRAEFVDKVPISFSYCELL